MADGWDVFSVAPPGQPSVAAPAAPQSDAGWDAFSVPAAPLPQQQVASQSQAQTQAPAAPQPSFGRSLALGARDVLEGVVGPAYNIASKPFLAAGLPVNDFSANLDALGLPRAETSGEKMASAVIQPVAGTLTGQGIGRAMASAASPVVQGVGQALQTQPAMQALSAGVGGATQEATDSPIAGLAASLALPVAVAGGARAISPNILADLSPERAAVLATATREGVPLTLAQQTGGKVARNFESTLANLPGSSGVQAAVNDEQQRAFNAAVLRRSGTNADVATPDVLNQSRANLGAVFDDLSARNTLVPDQQFATEMQGLANNVQRYVPQSQQGPLTARIEDVVQGLQSGTMEGRAYREMDSKLGQAIAGATDGDTRSYLGQLRDTLRGAMDRSISPEDQQAWQDVRQRYAALMQTAKAVDRPTEGNALGNISPAQLAQATRNAPSRSFAFGRGNLDDLARLGQVALKQTVPDSGTAQRTAMANTLTGKSLYPALAAAGATMNPLFMAAPLAEIALPRAAAGIYHSNALAQYLTNDLASGIAPRVNTLLPLAAAQNEVQQIRQR